MIACMYKGECYRAIIEEIYDNVAVSVFYVEYRNWDIINSVQNIRLLEKKSSSFPCPGNSV